MYTPYQTEGPLSGTDLQVPNTSVSVRRRPQSSGRPRSAREGRAGSSVLALRSRAQVRTALCRLLLLPHFEAGEQLDQPDVPLLGQEQEEEAQADDDDGDDPDPVEDYLTGVVINHCARQERSRVTQRGARPGRRAGPETSSCAAAEQRSSLTAESSSVWLCSWRAGAAS